MNIDEKIKAELEAELTDTSSDSAHNQGMFTIVSSAYKGSLRRWMIVVSAVTLAVTAIMFWTGYEFVDANTVDERLFWGTWFILSFVAQVSLKQWTWMEMNRNSVIRELKRLESAVEQLRA